MLCTWDSIWLAEGSRAMCMARMKKLTFHPPNDSAWKKTIKRVGNDEKAHLQPPLIPLWKKRWGKASNCSKGGLSMSIYEHWKLKLVIANRAQLSGSSTSLLKDLLPIPYSVVIISRGWRICQLVNMLHISTLRWSSLGEHQRIKELMGSLLRPTSIPSRPTIKVEISCSMGCKQKLH